ncbi:MAG TPA: hypothetical protein VFN61_03040 [Acidimicrobiales bacterium]|nr:hypothetical protein [Acidimicrobiales bacterium]
MTHRDGSRRLAVLSYLSSDPDRVAVSYGVDVTSPGSAQRAGVVYALARLLDAWQRHEADMGAVVHGDLSSKNVLWSNGPVPEVFVLDCDGAVVLPGRSGPATTGGPSRPATPNWDDPARRPGDPIGVATDRYLLGIIFLRVLGAAHFPIQARQRLGATVDVDLELPRAWRRITDMPALWSLCERSLSVADPKGRPAPGEWVSELEHLLGSLGAGELGTSIRAAQGDPGPAAAPVPGPVGPTPATVSDVRVRPVLRQRVASTWQLVRTGPVVGSARGPGGATLVVPLGAGTAAAAGLFGVPPGSPPKAYVRAGWAAFRATHRLVARLLRSPGRRAHGLRRLAGVVVLDLAVASLGLFLFGMIVSPWIGL